MMLNKTILSGVWRLVNLNLIPSDFIELPHGRLSGELLLSEGKSYGLVGSNGIGKSSVLRWSKQNLDASIGYLDQGRLQPLVNLKTREVFRLLELELSANFKDLIQFFDFESLLDQKVNNLSGGENQLLKIIITFGIDRDWYFLDEPFLNLSEKNRAKVLGYIKNLKKEKSFFIVEHNQEVLRSLVDKIYEISGEQGRYYVR